MLVNWVCFSSLAPMATCGVDPLPRITPFLPWLLLHGSLPLPPNQLSKDSSLCTSHVPPLPGRP